MRQLKNPTTGFGMGESLGWGLFTICFGSAFLYMGIIALSPVWAAVKSGTGFAYMMVAFLAHGHWVFGSLISLAFGIMIVWGGVHQIKVARKFGKPEASISEEMIRPGQEFRFLYQQKCRQQTEIKSIGVFLVFREKVNYEDVSDPKTQNIDRLIQQCTHAGRVYEAGEMIHEEHTLQIPTRKMGIRNRLMQLKNAEVKTSWVVKVQLDLGNHTDIWKEYEMGVSTEPVEIARW